MNEKYYELMKKEVIRRAKRRIHLIRVIASIITLIMIMVWAISISAMDSESWIPILGFIGSSIYLLFFAWMAGGMDDVGR